MPAQYLLPRLKNVQFGRTVLVGAVSALRNVVVVDHQYIRRVIQHRSNSLPATAVFRDLVHIVAIEVQIAIFARTLRGLRIAADAAMEVVTLGAAVGVQKPLRRVGARHNFAAHRRHADVGVGLAFAELEQFGSAFGGEQKLLRVEGHGDVARLGKRAALLEVRLVAAGVDDVFGGRRDAAEEERPKGAAEVAETIRVQQRIAG